MYLCPDIGKVMEQSAINDNLVRADARRRMGVLAFDGNLKKRKRVTYKRIWKHLEEKYQ